MCGFLMSSFSTCHGSMRIDPSFSVTLNLKINFCVEGPLNIVLTVPMKNYVAKKIIVKWNLVDNLLYLDRPNS